MDPVQLDSQPCCLQKCRNVRVHTNRRTQTPLIHRHPQHGEEADVSETQDLADVITEKQTEDL